MQKQLGKDAWMDMFKKIGLDEADMKKWHQMFESNHPDHHQGFLEWLGVPGKEITQIRSSSR